MLADPRALIAVDLGAESCRVSLLRWIGGRPQVGLVHRFANGPVRRADDTLRWPLEAIVAGVEQGICLCAELATEGIRSIAVDGWAVDYVRVGADREPLDEPFCYRDERTVAAEIALHQRIYAERLREITGLNLQRINTLYQQVSDRAMGLPAGSSWMNLPEYLLFRWGAPAVAEYTNATHTQMVDIQSGGWSPEVLAAADIAADTMPRIVFAGERLGKLAGPLAGVPGLEDVELLAPACHDTASAIAGIAADADSAWGYISAGTWSLVGTVLPEACLKPEAFAAGFTNLGAVGGGVCFHVSVNGMWILKQCMDAWAAQGGAWEIGALVQAAALEPPPDALLDLHDPELLLVGEMPARINAQRQAAGQPLMDVTPETASAMASLIFHSLAECYRQTLEQVERLSGKKLERIFLVGGGSRNGFLRQLTEEKTGIPVVCGPAESSTMGNFAVQLATLEGGGVGEWARRLQDAVVD